MECLPILEKHVDYLKSKLKKQKEGKTAVNAVECITREVGEREKVTLIEIGEDDLKCMEVKRIVDAIKDENHYEPINISTIMPPDRKRRYKVLHHNLVKQSPLRLGLWTFDNYGKSPQSVFIFLVKLEEDFNSIMNNVKTIRPGLL